MLKYISSVSFFLCKSFSIMEKFFVLFWYYMHQGNNKDKYLFIRLIQVFIFLNYRNFTFKSKSSLALCLDSDSEDELKRSVALSQRLCEVSGCEQQQEDLEKVSNFSSKYLANICIALTVQTHAFITSISKHNKYTGQIINLMDLLKHQF